ncbi:MAG TPA: T9SS type A sorting domain-containing protein [Bacteroidales bacterium]|nr:T9SS type A sorting domain-containing protein [Bacteroidales bacterium]
MKTKQRIKETLLCLHILSILLFCNLKAIGQTQLDQSNTGSVTNYICIMDGYIIGQSFTAGLSGTLKQIKIDFALASCNLPISAFSMTVEIIDGDGFGGAVLATENVVVPIPYTRTMLPVTFSAPANITAGLVYTIKITAGANQICDNIMGPVPVCGRWYMSNANTYSNGFPYNNGSIDGVFDRYFETYVSQCITSQTDQSHTGSLTDYTCLTDGQIIGQSFTAGLSGRLQQIKIDFELTSCNEPINSYSMMAQIIEGDGYGGAVLATENVVVPLPYSRTMLPISFSSPVNISGGQVYTIKITAGANQICSNMMGPVPVCGRWYTSNANTYANGFPYYNGSFDGVADRYFETQIVNDYNSYSTDVITACNSYLWLDGNTYTSDNNTATYSITGGAANGCDSLITLNLTINNVTDVTTTLSDITITANDTAAAYAWLDCDDNYSVISGETGMSYTPSANGNYAVQLTENGCVDTSACVSVNSIGIMENGFGNGFAVYPNATAGDFSVNLGSFFESTTVTIIDIRGTIIDKKNFARSKNLDLKLEKSSGVYFVIIESGTNKAVIRMIKN